jgi:hypothetical protein
MRDRTAQRIHDAIALRDARIQLLANPNRFGMNWEA